jgi:hypothetical protein
MPTAVDLAQGRLDEVIGFVPVMAERVRLPQKVAPDTSDVSVELHLVIARATVHCLSTSVSHGLARSC